MFEELLTDISVEDEEKLLLDTTDARWCIATFAESIGARAGSTERGRCVIVTGKGPGNARRVLVATKTIGEMHCHVHGVLMGIEHAENFITVMMAHSYLMKRKSDKALPKK